jgi:hypothetical protein
VVAVCDDAGEGRAGEKSPPPPPPNQQTQLLGDLPRYPPFRRHLEATVKGASANMQVLLTSSRLTGWEQNAPLLVNWEVVCGSPTFQTQILKEEVGTASTIQVGRAKLIPEPYIRISSARPSRCRGA